MRNIFKLRRTKSEVIDLPLTCPVCSYELYSSNVDSNLIRIRIDTVKNGVWSRGQYIYLTVDDFGAIMRFASKNILPGLLVTKLLSLVKDVL